MKIRTKEILAGYSFALPSLLGFMIFFAIPFLMSLYYCFTTGIGGTDFVGLKNFIDLLKSNSFLLSVKNTLIFNMICVPLVMVLSLLFALLLNKELQGITYFKSFFVLPLVIPVSSIILVWSILFNSNGVLNNFLNTLGINPVEWMRSKWSVAVLILLFIWKNCGYNIILFLAGLNGIPKQFYEAARIDGAGSFQSFKNITLPFLVPTAFFVFIISILNSFKVFREAYLLAGNYPYLDIYMLQHFMNNNFVNLSYQRLTTAAFFMAMLITVLVFVLFRIESRFGRDIG